MLPFRLRYFRVVYFQVCCIAKSKTNKSRLSKDRASVGTFHHHSNRHCVRARRLPSARCKSEVRSQLGVLVVLRKHEPGSNRRTSVQVHIGASESSSIHGSMVRNISLKGRIGIRDTVQRSLFLCFSAAIAVVTAAAREVENSAMDSVTAEAYSAVWDLYPGCAAATEVETDSVTEADCCCLISSAVGLHCHWPAGYCQSFLSWLM